MELKGKLFGIQTQLSGGSPLIMESGSWGNGSPDSIDITKGDSDWEGWGTALKPAAEFICMARKPLSEKTIVKNVLKWGTGGINIDGCRVGYKNEEDEKSAIPGSLNNKDNKFFVGIKEGGNKHNTTGRFPANVILECTCENVIEGEKGEVKETSRVRKYNHGGGQDIIKDEDVKGIDNYNDKGDIHTDPNCPCRILNQQSVVSKKQGKVIEHNGSGGIWNKGTKEPVGRTYNDKGGASRFFYNAKVSKKERNLGLEDFEDKVIEGRDEGQDGRSVAFKKRPTPTKNIHPTVKPVKLMAYLCRLITPPGGVVLDPFMGSGSTGIAALLEGFKFIGMDMDEEYCKISEQRIKN